MGTILMKAKMEDFNKDNIENLSLKHLNSSEIYTLSSNLEFRETLIKTDIPIHMQEMLHSYKSFSYEEALGILENCSNVMYGLYRWYQFPLDVLLKNISKLDLSEIEYQQSLTPEFVEKYQRHMALGHFINKRISFGDIMNFVHIPEIARRYIKKFLSPTKTREEVAECIMRIKPDCNVIAMNTMLDRIYNTPINAELVTDYYTNDGRRSHSVDSAVGFYKRNHEEHYDNWQQFVENAQRNNVTGLVHAIFDDFFSEDIISFCGIQS